MLDSSLFAALEAIARMARGSEQPFGGLQLVFSGDFLQLPPIALGQPGVGFAFQAPAWQACEVSTVALATVVRQAGDMQLTAMLHELRQGRLSSTTSIALQACHVSNKPPPEDATEIQLNYD